MLMHKLGAYPMFLKASQDDPGYYMPLQISSFFFFPQSNSKTVQKNLIFFAEKVFNSIILV